MEQHKHILGFDIEAGPGFTTYSEAKPTGEDPVPVLQEFKMLVLFLLFT